MMDWKARINGTLAGNNGIYGKPVTCKGVEFVNRMADELYLSAPQSMLDKRRSAINFRLFRYRTAMYRNFEFIRKQKLSLN